MNKTKTILVTGGTGSFGSAFIARLLQTDARKIVIFSRDERKQKQMKEELDDPRLRFWLGDVRDRYRLRRAFEEIDIVVHAAALKDVPFGEYNPFEFVETNVLGSWNVLEAALDSNVQKVLALSSDKAVNAVNLYGGTKFMMEKIVRQANSYSGKRPTRFSCVRYGNVVGSRGSVVETFKRQAEQAMADGMWVSTPTLTITDPRMTRFWITLPEAVEFVLKSLEEMQGGEVFVPKIPSMKVTDLARVMAPGCEFKTIGIRPGEKLYETLVTDSEARTTIDAGWSYVILPEHKDWGGEYTHKGTRVEEGFEFTSQTARPMSPKEIKEVA